MRLSEAMEIPLRERNLLLQSAGFVSAYSETDLDEPAMAPVLDVLNHVLLHHEPLPAVVVDRFWNVRRKNKAADFLLAVDGDPEMLLKNIGSTGVINLALLTLHPMGLRKYISNWEQAAPALLRRRRSEALASGDKEVHQRFGEYIDLTGDFEDSDPAAGNQLPILPLELNISGLELSLFSVISTFGTPQDITTDEQRIEAFYLAYEKAEAFFKSVA